MDLSWAQWHTSDMKRIIVMIVIAAAACSLAASYSLALLAGDEPCYQIIADNGETLDLDDHVWSKRWNGLEISQSIDNIYTIDDNGYTVLAAPADADWDDIMMEIACGFDTPSLLILQSFSVDEEFLLDEGIRDILLVSQNPSERDMARLEAKGFTIYQAECGSVVEIDDGLYLPDRRGSIAVQCPHCGRTFTLYL